MQLRFCPALMVGSLLGAGRAWGVTVTEPSRLEEPSKVTQSNL